uniref:C2H2-type domain-containing protein n=2 Tax=Sarcophilus harrisii TaxID=9305 RepID=A0A7N4P2F3_SARHA
PAVAAPALLLVPVGSRLRLRHDPEVVPGPEVTFRVFPSRLRALTRRGHSRGKNREKWSGPRAADPPGPRLGLGISSESPPPPGYAHFTASLPEAAPFCFAPRSLSLRRDTSCLRVPAYCCHIGGCDRVFDSLPGYVRHYQTLHQNACSFCRRSFPSDQLLDIHLLERHGTVPSSPTRAAAARERRPIPFYYQCPVWGCTDKFMSPEEQTDHLIRIHHYPAHLWFDSPPDSQSSGQQGSASSASASAGSASEASAKESASASASAASASASAASASQGAGVGVGAGGDGGQEPEEAMEETVEEEAEEEPVDETEDEPDEEPMGEEDMGEEEEDPESEAGSDPEPPEDDISSLSGPTLGFGPGAAGGFDSAEESNEDH